MLLHVSTFSLHVSDARNASTASWQNQDWKLIWRKHMCHKMNWMHKRHQKRKNTRSHQSPQRKREIPKKLLMRGMYMHFSIVNVHVLDMKCTFHNFICTFCRFSKKRKDEARKKAKFALYIKTLTCKQCKPNQEGRHPKFRNRVSFTDHIKREHPDKDTQTEVT